MFSLATDRQLEGLLGMLRYHRLQGKPEHAGDVVVLHILTMLGKGIEDRPPLVKRESLQGCRQVKPHHGRVIVFGQLDKSFQGSLGRIPVLAQQLDHPGADVLVPVAKQLDQAGTPGAGKTAGHVHRPECPQPRGRRGGRVEHFLELAMNRRRVERPGCHPGLEQHSGLANIPVIGVGLQPG